VHAARLALCSLIDSLPGHALYGRDIRQFWTRLLDRAVRGELPDADDPSAQIRPTNLMGVHEYLISGQPPAPGTRCPAIAPSDT
jgi:hypothetical protein